MPEQVFHPYTAWEDWQAGMWHSPGDVLGEMARSARILRNQAAFLTAAREMLRAWPNSAEQNLTDMSLNRRAWVGQATCCHHAGVPERATRLAWWTLTAAEQAAANQTADLAMAEWQMERGEAERPGLFPLLSAERVIDARA